MRVLYDSNADAIEITFIDVARVERDVSVHVCGTVSLSGGRPVGVELLEASGGVDAAVRAIVAAYGTLDADALRAAACAALAAPDKQLVLTIAAHAA